MQQNQPANFKNRIGFVLASVGSAVGMGNIWMFPYRVGQYGGAAFLLIYFGFVALFGWVGLSGEFAFGRLTGTGPIGSYAYALRSRGKKGGGVLGAIPLLGSLGIAIGYAVIVGWVVRYCWGAVSGSLFAVGSEEYFGQITGPFGSLLWHGVVVLVTVLVLARGVLQGIEKVNRIIMPAFFVLFLVVAVYVGFLPGAAEGYRYLLIPQWEKLLDPMTWVMAMGQAFFSLSITGSGMIIYGSYLSKKEDIPRAAMQTALLDTCAALLAGFAILPAVTTHLKLPRKAAVVLVGALAFAAGAFIEFEPYLGKWMDAITIYVVPFGALLCAFIIYWVLGGKRIGEELVLGRKKALCRAFLPTARYLYVGLAVLVFILSIICGGIG